MKYKIFIIVFLFFIIAKFFGQENIMENNQYFDFETMITFNENQIRIEDLDMMTDETVISVGTYFIQDEDGIPFINITFDDGRKEKWLMLSNGELCYLYKTDGSPFFSGASGSSRSGELLFPYPEFVDGTSYLIEKNTEYPPSNLKSFAKINKPWVEGVSGQGIHESLYLTRDRTTAIYISSGFVSYDRPHLYRQNSRPKIVNVSVAGKFSFNVHLEDTPNFQKIDLPERLTKDDILKVEIIDIYAGTRYEDTCINFIVFDTRGQR